MRAEPLFSADCIGKSFRSRTVLKSASAWAREGAGARMLGEERLGEDREGGRRACATLFSKVHCGMTLVATDPAGPQRGPALVSSTESWA